MIFWPTMFDQAHCSSDMSRDTTLCSAFNALLELVLTGKKMRFVKRTSKASKRVTVTRVDSALPVSYTHLTLPTICSV